MFNSTSVVSTNLMADLNTTYSCAVPSSPPSSGHSNTGTSAGKETSFKENKTGAFSYIRSELENRGISTEAQHLIISSWWCTTRKQYETYIKQWFHYCEGKEDPFKPRVTSVLDFLSNLYGKGIRYSSMGTALSAVFGFIKIISGTDAVYETCVSSEVQHDMGCANSS